jgi:hypothetical protein
MTKKCKSAAQACIKSQCGTDYDMCYRNRTDIMADVVKTSSSNTGLENSMNKVGGILDRLIIVGLCSNTIQNNKTCEEIITANVALDSASQYANSAEMWGSASGVRDGWRGAGTINTALSGASGQTQKKNAAGEDLCSDESGMGEFVCGTVIGSTSYDTPLMQTADEIRTLSAINNIFQQAIYDLEIEAQAKYNAKLTKQMSMCLAGNSVGGLNAGVTDSGSFMWVKLKNSKVPTGYETKGLSSTAFSASNDLYGSFCRVRVMVQSSDADIQKVLAKQSTQAYFAVGDPFTCGSWLNESAIDQIVFDKVCGGKSGAGAKSAADCKEGKLRNGQGWAVAGLSVLGSAGGFFGADALMNKSKTGGLIDYKGVKNDCQKKLENSILAIANCTDSKVSIAGTVTLADGKHASYYRCDATAATATAAAATEEMQGNLNSCQGTKGAKNGAAWAADIAGGAIGGTLLGVGSYQAIKASNVKKWNNAEGEVMNAMKDVRCYVGSEEVGSFGDIVSTEL